MEAAIRKGRELPRWYQDEPPSYSMDAFYLQSFWDLDTERYYDNGPIPYMRIREYGYQIGLYADIINSFIVLIRSMDNVYLKWIADQQDR